MGDVRSIQIKPVTSVDGPGYLINVDELHALIAMGAIEVKAKVIRQVFLQKMRDVYCTDRD